MYPTRRAAESLSYLRGLRASVANPLGCGRSPRYVYLWFLSFVFSQRSLSLRG